MSCVRFFDNIPHIIRFGMHDAEKEVCWIKFWRNGVCFTVDVKREDVQGTTFYKQWVPLLDEFDRDNGTSFRQHIETHWHPLCDLIMSTSIRTLRQLAPPKEYWVTLYDYLHTPAYRLRLFAPESKDEIEIEVTKGPTDSTAYELEPVSSDNLNVPEGIPRFQSRELVLLKNESDWRQRAEHVRTPDGQQLTFKGLNRSTRSAETGQISNTSLDIARDQLKAYEESQARGESRAAETQRIVGVAIYHGIPGNLADEQDGKPKTAGLLWSKIKQ